MFTIIKYLPRRFRLVLKGVLILGFSWSLTSILLIAGPHATSSLVMAVYAIMIVLVSTRWGIGLALFTGLVLGAEFSWFLPTGLGAEVFMAEPRWTGLLVFGGIALGLGFIVRNSQGRTARSTREEFLRSFSAKLLRLQDEERRKIARELHDSLGQYLTALRINIDLLENASMQWKPEKELFAESRHIVNRALAETRTLSYLLHPPLLDEAGFAAAARDYVEGFSRRSGINATLCASQEIERLPAQIELALFRILQECLTNVHRHSGSKMVEIHLDKDAEFLVLEIKDAGRGMSRELLDRFQGKAGMGVGLAGMRERAEELGGELKVYSGVNGTTVTVIVPLTASERSGAATRSPWAA
jgi:signal transduction histidine kinase